MQFHRLHFQSRVEKRKREEEFTQSIESLNRANLSNLEEIQRSFSAKLQQAINERTFLQQSLERLALERDKLSRQNKKLRSSFLCKPDEENTQIDVSQKTLDSFAKSSAIEEARSDYRAGDVDVKAEQKRFEFESRVGNRLGSVKYADWLRTQSRPPADEN